MAATRKSSLRQSRSAGKGDRATRLPNRETAGSRADVSGTRLPPLPKPGAPSDDLRKSLLHGGVGEDVETSLDAVVAICDSVAEHDVHPAVIGLLHLVVAATDAARSLLLAAKLAGVGRTVDGGTARAVGFARLALRGFVIISKNEMAVTPRMMQIAVIDTIHQGVRFLERRSGRRFDSFTRPDRLVVATQLAQEIYDFTGHSPKPLDLLPAMDSVSATWDWYLDRERGGVNHKRKPLDEQRKAAVFFDLLSKLTLTPQAMASLYQTVKLYAPWLLDSA